ncbi:MAG: hypothetical protein WCQ50_13390 [Spirochaetota bacterium]
MYPTSISLGKNPAAEEPFQLGVRLVEVFSDLQIPPQSRHCLRRCHRRKSGDDLSSAGDQELLTTFYLDQDFREIGLGLERWFCG